MDAVMGVAAYGQAVAILRQELDSMVRVMYLLSLSDHAARSTLVASLVNGVVMRHANGKRVTDKEMVDLGQILHGWAKSVYQFGCSFIHLSSFHDWNHRNPLDLLSTEERRQVMDHMRYYHGGPSGDKPTFQEFATFLPRVLGKIAGNLGCYLDHLENGEDLE